MIRQEGPHREGFILHEVLDATRRGRKVAATKVL